VILFGKGFHLERQNFPRSSDGEKSDVEFQETKPEGARQGVGNKT
jgi:hypothetical protein